MIEAYLYLFTICINCLLKIIIKIKFIHISLKFVNYNVQHYIEKIAFSHANTD